MLDVSHIPNQSNNVSIFYTQGATAWQTWTKPRNAKFIWIMCIGGGSGGYGNGTGIVSVVPGGGGGAVTRALFQANVLPDILYIQPGVGGSGGASGGNLGGIGGRSYVSISPSTAGLNTVCISGATPATSENGEGVATTTLAGLLNLGTFITVAGQNGASSTNIQGLLTSITGAGAGNETTSPGNGYSIVTNITNLSIPGGAGGTTGGAGGDGIWSWKPMFGLAGAGGGAGSAGAGGRGGNGAFGCGGGSGGGGSTVGGAGGRGGDGLVIIATF